MEGWGLGGVTRRSLLIRLSLLGSGGRSAMRQFHSSAQRALGYMPRDRTLDDPKHWYDHAAAMRAGRRYGERRRTGHAA